MIGYWLFSHHIERSFGIINTSFLTLRCHACSTLSPLSVTVLRDSVFLNTGTLCQIDRLNFRAKPKNNVSVIIVL